jgi:glycosyltransferase involved in cell wall biosynthesis
MNVSKMPKSIAISWYFAHHAGHNGYKQILGHTKPQAVVGIDERLPPAVDRWHRVYPWLYEFRAAFAHRRNPCEVLHILYGEAYFRFSPWLFGRVPVVATFHQPPQVLRRFLLPGPESGRVSSLLRKKRFRKLSAAIIISEGQRAVLEELMPADRIHLIPLGASTLPLIAAESRLRQDPDPQAILTVGNWLRDWAFYFDFVDHCRDHHPDWHFRLVNRNLPSVWHERVQAASNMSWLKDLDDDTLLKEYAGASCLFLPLLEATGNNAVNEALAMGCPVICNVDLGVPDEEAIVTRCETSHEAFSSAIARWQDASAQQRSDLRERSQRAVRSLDWSIVGAKTLDLYQSLL